MGRLNKNVKNNMTCSFEYDGKQFATKQQIVDYINNTKPLVTTNVGLSLRYANDNTKNIVAAGQKLMTVKRFINLDRFSYNGNTYKALFDKLKERANLTTVLDTPIYTSTKFPSNIAGLYIEGL